MLESARCYPGTVMVEGTTLSEGRGTTRPFELIGAPDIDPKGLIAKMHELEPKWLRGCELRTCSSRRSKARRAPCAGVQIHVEDEFYSHAAFRPWRLQALAFKALRASAEVPALARIRIRIRARSPAIDLLSGSDLLRICRRRSRPKDLDALVLADEKAWHRERRAYLLY